MIPVLKGKCANICACIGGTSPRPCGRNTCKLLKLLALADIQTAMTHSWPEMRARRAGKLRLEIPKRALRCAWCYGPHSDHGVSSSLHALNFNFGHAAWLAVTIRKIVPLLAVPHSDSLSIRARPDIPSFSNHHLVCDACRTRPFCPVKCGRWQRRFVHHYGKIYESRRYWSFARFSAS